MILTNIFLVLLGGVLVVRLVIWQFFPNTQPFFNEEFSNVTVAFLILVLCIPWLLGKFFTGQPLKKSGLELPISLLLIAAVCSLFWAPDLGSSLRGVLVLVSQAAFFYMLLDTIDTPTRLRRSLVFLLGMTVAVSVFGIKTFFDFWHHPHIMANAALQESDRGVYYLLTHPRAVSFFGWPNILSGYLLFFLPLMIVLSFRLKKFWQRAGARVGLFLSAVCFLYTCSFLGWSSFLFSGIVCGLLFSGKFDIKTWLNENRKFLFYSLLIFLFLLLLVILRKNYLMSMTPRVFYYKTVFRLLGSNPVIGYGWDSFRILCRPLTRDMNNLSGFVHNSYLQIWLECGIIGLLGIVLLVKRVFCQIKDNIDPTDKSVWVFIAISWGIIAFLIDNLSNYTMLMPNIALFWWTMLAVFSAMVKIKKGQEPKKTPRSLFGPFLLIGVVTLIILTRILGGYLLYYQAMYLNKPNDINKSIETLNRAKVLDPWSSYLPAGAANLYLRLYGNMRLKSFLKLAANDYLEAVRRSPRLYYNYFALGQIYTALGDKTQGQNFLLRSRALSPSEYALDNKMFHQSDNH